MNKELSSSICFTIVDAWHDDPSLTNNCLGSLVEVSFLPAPSKTYSSPSSSDGGCFSSESENSCSSSSDSSTSSSSSSSSSDEESCEEQSQNCGIKASKNDSVDSGFGRNSPFESESEEGLIEDDSDWENYKAYQKPFVSLNIEENFDNNNPDWNYLRNLGTDEDRYRVVRDVWQNDFVPNPNKNLSLFCSSMRFISPNLQIKTKKRKRTDWNVGPTPKRIKLENLGFYKNAVEHAEETVTDDFQADIKQTSGGSAQCIKDRYDEKISQLQDTITEVCAFHGFYQGLPDQESNDQSLIEHEHVDIDNLYRSFCYFYNWDYRFFNHPNSRPFH